jgi:hypothetical protein
MGTTFEILRYRWAEPRRHGQSQTSRLKSRIAWVEAQKRRAEIAAVAARAVPMV